MLFAQQFDLQGRVFNLLANSLNQLLLLCTNDDGFHRKDLTVTQVLQTEVQNDLSSVSLSPSHLLVLADVLGHLVTYRLSRSGDSLAFSLQDSFHIYENPHGNTIDQEVHQLASTQTLYSSLVSRVRTAFLPGLDSYFVVSDKLQYLYLRCVSTNKVLTAL